MMHDKRLKKYSINFTVFGNKKIIVKNYQNHNGTIVGFITQSKSIEFTMKKFAVYQRPKEKFRECMYQKSFGNR